MEDMSEDRSISDDPLERAFRAAGLSERTRHTYRQWESRLLATAELPREEITREHADMVIHSMLEAQAPLASVRLARSALRFVLRAYGAPAGVHPSEIHGPKASPVLYDDPQVWALIRVLNVRDAAAVALMYGSGLGIGELLRSRTGDVEITPARIHVRSEAGERTHTTGVPREFMNVVAAWLAARESIYRADRKTARGAGRNEFLFVPWRVSALPDDGAPARPPLGVRALQIALAEGLTIAGLPPGPPSSLRASFAVKHLRAGADHDGLASRMGLAGAASLAHYSRLIDSTTNLSRTPLLS